MDINNIKMLFFTILAITLIVYFIYDIVVYKIESYVKEIYNYSEENEIFKIDIVKSGLEDFKNNFTVKKYIENYEFLEEKKKNDSLSKNESTLLENIEKDIHLLNVSFLTAMIIDNPEEFPIELLNIIIRFKKFIILSQVIKIFKIVLTIASLILFIDINF